MPLALWTPLPHLRGLIEAAGESDGLSGTSHDSPYSARYNRLKKNLEREGGHKEEGTRTHNLCGDRPSYRSYGWRFKNNSLEQIFACFMMGAVVSTTGGSGDYFSDLLKQECRLKAKTSINIIWNSYKVFTAMVKFRTILA
ncbi:hypothetical protein RRG08_033038 [Elysia crispata]|uniref:Uncharacterized protein n=1 Tax=Elysia crispata TaxID=231223 RepID=A0AAE1A940_9GAST|nr:hypothetical protein RRG08_033038 [Elysia crispata]